MLASGFQNYVEIRTQRFSHEKRDLGALFGS